MGGTTTETPATAERPVVKIYVTLGGGNDQNTRDIEFKLPAGLDRMELLDLGFAIDGNEAVATIAWNRATDMFEGPFGADEASSFNAALRNAQRGLVRHLRKRGFDPQFA